MELTVRERLVLLGMLPKEANFITLRLMRVLKEDLSFSDDENEKLKFVQQGESLKWNEKVADELVKEMEVGETMMNLIVKQLKDMDSTSKLTADHFTIYEKFVEKPQEPIAKPKAKAKAKAKSPGPET